MADRAHPLFARWWAAALRIGEPAAVTRHRAALVDGLHGSVVEVGAGTGILFSHYGEGVERVLAVEPEPYLRDVAVAAAAQAPVEVEVVAGEAAHLPLEAESVDAVVCCLVLCSVPDQAAALQEFKRVLKPGGELRYYEHVAEAGGGWPLRLQRLVERSGVWRKLGGGCHVDRATGLAIREAGFSIEHEVQPSLGPSWLVPVSAHVLGTARRG